MKGKKLLSLLLVFFLGISLLSGCGLVRVDEGPDEKPVKLEPAGGGNI